MATFDGKPTTKPVFVAWFTEETFARFREIYDTPGELPDNFEKWLRHAEGRLAGLSGVGIVPDKIIVDPEAMLKWARARGIKINNKTRGEFACIAFSAKTKH